MLIEPIESSLTFHEIFQRLNAYDNIVYLDSSDTGSKFSKYSFIFFNPFYTFRSKSADAFKILQKLLNKYRINSPGTDFPVSAAAGYISYDAGYLLENIKPKAVDELNWPLAEMGFYDSVLVYSHSKKQANFIYTGISEKNKIKRKESFKKQFEYINNAIASPVCFCKTGLNKSGKIKSNFTKQQYFSAIKKIKKYIEEGDVYQVNLSQRFYSSLATGAVNLYNIMRQGNKVPFSTYLKFGKREVLSFSMERFLRMHENNIETRPIKGTIARGLTSEEDRRNEEKLLSSRKNNAELLMITDLERNDLGKVCQYNSVHVSKLCEIENYATVHHLVSTIRGKIKKPNTHLDCLKACFPGGSITGAPKIRSMEIIDELEKVRRNVYCGTIGYFGFNDVSEFNIAIRTMMVDNGNIYFNAGGGITYDSDPQEEYQETLDKVKTFHEVLSKRQIS